MAIGKLERVPLREVWKKEAKDFTQWLEKNIDAIGEVLNIRLTAIEREKSVGSFSVDLLAEDNEGNMVVIENQLEKTDHDHLGKIITYLTGLGAKTAIWICEEPKPEHITALKWLNEISPQDVSFYLIKVRAFRIGESLPAPSFEIICSPTEEQKEIGEKKEELAQRHIDRLEFWGKLLEKASAKTKLHSNISPSKYHWLGTGAGISGLSYNYVIINHHASVELYIDRGKDSEEENKKIFDTLLSHKDEIEKDFGGHLLWERLDERRASRISFGFDSGLRDKEKWATLQDQMIEAMIRLEKALDKHVKQLRF